jgi:hypothetical protein
MKYPLKEIGRLRGFPGRIWLMQRWDSSLLWLPIADLWTKAFRSVRFLGTKEKVCWLGTVFASDYDT